MTLSVRDIAWLAGLIEGEGSFCLPVKSKSPVISIQMTDRDIIARAAALLGCEVRGPYVGKKVLHKETWVARVHGSRAVGWMQTLYVFLGERRQTKVRELLDVWKHFPSFPRGNGSSRLPAICHPERFRMGAGLCRQCYMKHWRASRQIT